MDDSKSNNPLTLDALIVCYNRQLEVELAVDSCSVIGVRRVYVLDNASDVPVVLQPKVSLIRSHESSASSSRKSNKSAEDSRANVLRPFDGPRFS